MKINSLDSLRSEKNRLESEAHGLMSALKGDLEVLKDAARPWALIHRAVTALIPSVLKKSKVTRIPINFLLKTIFGEKLYSKPGEPVDEKKQKIRQIAVGALETAAMVLLTRSIKRR